MDHPLLWIALASLVVAGVWYFHRVGRSINSASDARRDFERVRPMLQDAFFQTAASSGKPRGLRWKHCSWGDAIEFVRDKETAQLLALVEVTISFEAIAGGDMEGIAAVGNLRNATAVFFFQQGWQTAGRVVFNLNPNEAIEHFKGSYERVE